MLLRSTVKAIYTRCQTRQLCFHFNKRFSPHQLRQRSVCYTWPLFYASSVLSFRHSLRWSMAKKKQQKKTLTPLHLFMLQIFIKSQHLKRRHSRATCRSIENCLCITYNTHGLIGCLFSVSCHICIELYCNYSCPTLPVLVHHGSLTGLYVGVLVFLNTNKACRKCTWNARRCESNAQLNWLQSVIIFLTDIITALYFTVTLNTVSLRNIGTLYGNTLKCISKPIQ